MRVGLVICGSLNTLSGGYLYDRKLVEYLRARGDSVEIISLPLRNYAAHLTDNLYFRLPPRLDILIEDELNHPSLIAANTGRRGYPVVSLVHHLRCSEPRPRWQNGFYRTVEKKYLRSVDGFIFNSLTTKSAVNALTANSKPSTVAYPPTDRFGDPISEPGIVARARTREFRILFLGNLIERKGLAVLLDALSTIRDSSITLDIVGSLTDKPAYAKTIQNKVRVNDLSARVQFHGALDNDPLREILRQSHVLAVPSSYEGYGIAYLEGMGFGLPAIGTTAGAAHEIITDGQDGFLIQPGDFVTLASHLNALASDRDLLIRLSLRARERYSRHPSWEQTATEVRKFLLGML